MQFNQTASDRGSFVLAWRWTGERIQNLAAPQSKDPDQEPGPAEDPFVASYRLLALCDHEWTPLVALVARFPKQSLDVGFTKVVVTFGSA